MGEHGPTVRRAGTPKTRWRVPGQTSDKRVLGKLAGGETRCWEVSGEKRVVGKLAGEKRVVGKLAGAPPTVHSPSLGLPLPRLPSPPCPP
jgi:hypothetical protein